MSSTLSGPDSGQLASAISNRVVRVMSDFTGRGPTMARTYLHDDLISVVLRDSLTKGERNLVSHGRSNVVLDVRYEFQKTMRESLIAAVEEVADRKVIAFFSASHIDPDVALESFLLAPRTEDGDSVQEPGADEPGPRADQA
jgi:uncharacterized protein YbcI